MKQRGINTFKTIRRKVAEEYLSGIKTGHLARKYDIHPDTVRTWVREYKETVGVDALPTMDERIDEAKRIEQLESNYARALKVLGEKELELEILRELVKKTNPVSMKK